jgi:hypothetical protein
MLNAEKSGGRGLQSADQSPAIFFRKIWRSRQVFEIAAALARYEHGVLENVLLSVSGSIVGRSLVGETIGAIRP